MGGGQGATTCSASASGKRSSMKKSCAVNAIVWVLRECDALLKMRVGPRSGLAGAGFKPPRAALVKSHCGERRWKRRSRTPSGEVQGDERKQTADDVSKRIK